MKTRRNIVRYTNWGDTNRTGDEVCAVMQYLDGQQRNLITLRSSVDVHGGSQPTAALMRHAEFTYNGRGSLLSRTDRIAADGTSAETRYHYDPSRRMFPPLRRICNPTLLDIRIFNLQTRFNYICFEAPSQQAASIFRNKTTTFALTP